MGLGKTGEYGSGLGKEDGWLGQQQVGFRFQWVWEDGVSGVRFTNRVLVVGLSDLCSMLRWSPSGIGVGGRALQRCVSCCPWKPL